MKKYTEYYPLLIQIIFLFPNISIAQISNSIYWKNGYIPICWEKTTKDYDEEKEWVQEAINSSWETAGNINFTCWCPCSSDFQGVRVNIKDSKPIVPYLGNELVKYKKNVILNFEFKEWIPTFPYYDKPTDRIKYEKNIIDNSIEREDVIKKIAVHEFGHILGFAHQQSRDECKFSDCAFNDDAPKSAGWVTDCDRYSVMNYCNPYFYNNGELSTYDIKAVEKVYGNPVINGNEKKRFNSLSIAYQYIGKINGKIIPMPNIYLNKSRDIPKTRKKQQVHEGIPKQVYNKHKVIVYLEGNSKTLFGVKKVVYMLHPTFKGREIEIETYENRFAIELDDVWDHFQIKANVYFKNGTYESLRDIDLIPRPQNYRPSIDIKGIFGGGKDSN